jgi:hypothetical protein
VALVVWREAETLPAVHGEDGTTVLELLATQRDDALAEATRLRNQIHQILRQLDPEYREHLPNLQTQAGLHTLETYTVPNAAPLQRERAAAVRRLTERLPLALRQVDELTEQIQALAQERFSPVAAEPASGWPRFAELGPARFQVRPTGADPPAKCSFSAASENSAAATASIANSPVRTTHLSDRRRPVVRRAPAFPRRSNCSQSVLVRGGPGPSSHGSRPSPSRGNTVCSRASDGCSPSGTAPCPTAAAHLSR